MLGTRRRGVGGPALGSWRARRSGRALGALALGGLLCAGCSLVLDFGDRSDAGEFDAAPPIDADPTTPDAVDLCASFEPNGDISEAAMIVPGTYQAAICPAGDRDFFRFSVPDDADVVIEVAFDNMAGAGDLDLRLYDPEGTVIDISAGFLDLERIERSAAQGNRLAAGEYTAEVYGAAQSVQNDYTLTLAITVDDSGD
jgi:hypothetical protein